MIELEGFTNPGRFAPHIVNIVSPPRVRVLGHPGLPEPRRLAPQELINPANHCERIEIAGVVRGLGRERGKLRLDLSSSAGSFRAVLPQPWNENPSPATNWVGAVLRLRGVYGSLFNESRELSGLRVFVAGRDDVVVEDAGAESFDQRPVREIRSLLRFNDQAGPRVRVAGVVTHVEPGRGLFLQDDTAPLRVFTPQRDPLPPGTRVDAVGYPGTEDGQPVLRDGFVRVLGRAEQPAPCIAARRCFPPRFSAASCIWTEARIPKLAERSGRRQMRVTSQFLQLGRGVRRRFVPNVPDRCTQKRKCAHAEQAISRVPMLSSLLLFGSFRSFRPPRFGLLAEGNAGWFARICSCRFLLSAAQNSAHLCGMTATRRSFLATAGLSTAAVLAASRRSSSAAEARAATVAELDRILAAPVLRLDFLPQPVMVASIELLRVEKTFLLRTRSKDGVEVVTVPHQEKMSVAWPVLLKNVIPTFLGQDARRLESLLWDVYRAQSNYKLQGLVFWVAVAAVEMALLELMAQTAKRPLADFFGGTLRRDIAVYFASGNRGNTPAAEIQHLQKLVAGSGVKALKFRLGGRMSRNADDPPDRTVKLVPLARKTFGDDFTLYGDANSSYDAREGIRIGRLLEEHRYGFYEEPCEFDDLWSTKEVADALTIPVAGGEQEYSLHRWKWMIANRAVDIVQPDLHYGGGFIRATQVARMAGTAGMTVVPHMSGGGLGYVDVVQFASFTPNIGPHMEFKGNTSLPVACATSSLKCEGGVVRCPSGAGWGVTLDPDFVKRGQVVKAG